MKSKKMGRKGPKTAPKPQNRHSADIKIPAKSLKARKARPPRDAKRKPPAKRKEKKLPEYLTVDEKDALLAVIKSPRDKAIFRTLLYHGLRASEIGLLQLSDYRQGRSLGMDRLRIHRLKGSSGGDTNLVEAAGSAIRSWLKVRGTAPGPLFPSRNHRPIGRSRLLKLMHHYCRLARIPIEKAHPHALKHTCATLLLSERHESIADVQAHLGHANVQNTMIYARLTNPAHEERARRR